MTRRPSSGRGRAERLGLALCVVLAAGCSQPPPQERHPLPTNSISDALRQPSQADSRDALVALASEPGLPADAQENIARTAMDALALPSDRMAVLRALLANPGVTVPIRNYAHGLLADPDAFRMASQRAVLRCEIQGVDRRWDLTGERPIPGSSRRIGR